MARYHLAAVLHRLGDAERSGIEFAKAAAMPRDLCFPNKLEDIAVLQQAIESNASDSLAAFALGNLWYDKKQRGRAIQCWEMSVKRDPSFPTARRNLGLALVAAGDDSEAWHMFESAFDLDMTDARVLYELDQLAKRRLEPPAKRLARLEAYPGLVDQRDDLSIEHIAILNALGRHREALDRILSRSFRPWEGGEGRVPAQFVFAITRLAEEAIADGSCKAALDLLVTTDRWPESLGEGKLAGIQENDINFLKGRALMGLGEPAAAKDRFLAASTGLSEPS
ncbi:MAG: DUF5107 domain-containing protein, partial [Planctomycetota bacterium]